MDFLKEISFIFSSYSLLFPLNLFREPMGASFVRFISFFRDGPIWLFSFLYHEAPVFANQLVYSREGASLPVFCPSRDASVDLLVF